MLNKFTIQKSFAISAGAGSGRIAQAHQPDHETGPGACPPGWRCAQPF